jgi:multidrug efflux pump subunit AcrA (membrane-fusion protein)
VWIDGHEESFAPELATLLDRYVDLSHVRMLAIYHDSDRIADESREGMGASLIVESFTDTRELGVFDRARSVRDHTLSAFVKAVNIEQQPFYTYYRFLSRIVAKVHFPRFAVAALFVGLFLACCCFFPAQLKISATGELQPVDRQHVFAPHDGNAESIHVVHNQAVRLGEVLLTLESSELALELQRVDGQLQTAREKLLAIESARVFDDHVKAQALSASEAELQALIRNLKKEQQLLTAESASLVITSPKAGRILSWDIAGQLEFRPVRRGDLLMTVADLDGPWQLELQVPDAQVGYVLRASNVAARPLDVEYRLETDPGAVHWGRVRRVAARSEINQNGVASVKLIADVDVSGFSEARPGATVVADIHCGKHAIGYVWFHDVWDALRITLRW